MLSDTPQGQTALFLCEALSGGNWGTPLDLPIASPRGFHPKETPSSARNVVARQRKSESNIIRSARTRNRKPREGWGPIRLVEG
jgi:hypothetical protein